LTPGQLKTYEEMELAQIAMIHTTSDLVAERMGASSTQPIKVVSAVNAAVVAQKLLQIASGAVYESQDNYHLVDTARYEMVLDLAEQRQHTVVFFLWKHQKDFLIAEAKKRGLTHCLIDGTVNDKDRNEAVDFFQKGFYRICFAHPQSAAHGLTLTRGTATIWASPTYNLEHYQQGLKRIYRAGQTSKTETIVIVDQNTIEERVWEALQNKKVRMDDLLTKLT
jgi:SNF2 family DNA or RNA helicase